MPYRIAALFCLFTASAAEAHGPVTIVLESGKSLSAHVDERTDGQRLWLRFEAASTVLLRPIAWERVERAVVDGKEFNAAAFRSVAIKRGPQVNRRQAAPRSPSYLRRAFPGLSDAEIAPYILGPAR